MPYPTRAATADGPDFLCVGLQKAGTGWLYDQLADHPDFWMPPFKEVHFFDRTFPHPPLIASARAFARRTKTPGGLWRRLTKPGQHARDQAFFETALMHPSGDRDLDRYARLFAPKGPRLSGDITPGYSGLEEADVAAIAKRFPQARVCLMLREPASRLWSSWRMSVEDAADPVAAEQDVAGFKRFAERPGSIARSYPSVIARKWRAAFGERFRFFFLEDVEREPEAARAKILSFIGGDPAKSSGHAAGFNAKAKTRSPARSAAVSAYLRERFADEREACATMFGGPAERWPGAPY